MSPAARILGTEVTSLPIPSVVALALPRRSFSTPNASGTAGTGDTNPIARRTRSVGSIDSDPGTSLILPSFHSRRTVFSAFTLPFSPANSLVAIDQSRFTPSSCEEEVRSLVGQKGQTGFNSGSGGIGSSSNCVTDFASWRFEVPTHSEPLSPPPLNPNRLFVAHRYRRS